MCVCVRAQAGRRARDGACRTSPVSIVLKTFNPANHPLSDKFKTKFHAGETYWFGG